MELTYMQIAILDYCASSFEGTWYQKDNYIYIQNNLYSFDKFYINLADMERFAHYTVFHKNKENEFYHQHRKGKDFNKIVIECFTHFYKYFKIKKIRDNEEIKNIVNDAWKHFCESNNADISEPIYYPTKKSIYYSKIK